MMIFKYKCITDLNTKYHKNWKFSNIKELIINLKLHNKQKYFYKRIL
jgi:hypothetical protein